MSLLDEHERPLRDALAHNRWALGVDIGANCGIWTRWMAERCERVVAIEPHPVAFRDLERAVADLPNAECCNAAAWAEAGTVPLATYATSEHSTCLPEHPIPGSVPGATAAPNVIEVRAEPLSALLRQHTARWPLFVKVDVEGGELAVLRGAGEWLDDRRVTWLIECHTDRAFDVVRRAMASSVLFRYGACRYLFGAILNVSPLLEA
jgi:FkbM family methyltransferase